MFLIDVYFLTNMALHGAVDCLAELMSSSKVSFSIPVDFAFYKLAKFVLISNIPHADKSTLWDG